VPSKAAKIKALINYGIISQVMLRGLRGLQLIGGDVCEVSPLLDPTGHTALNAANLLFEILCVVADAVAQRRT
jgi:guanidinopropionase